MLSDFQNHFKKITLLTYPHFFLRYKIRVCERYRYEKPTLINVKERIASTPRIREKRQEIPRMPNVINHALDDIYDRIPFLLPIESFRLPKLA